MQVVPNINVDEETPIIDQLATLTEHINALDVDVEKRMEEWEEEKIQMKLVGKISQEVAINKVKLSEVITDLETIIHQVIQILYKLCTVDHFTINITL